MIILPESMDNLLANVLGVAQLRNLRVAETEKVRPRDLLLQQRH